MIASIYNNYLSTYRTNEISKYDTHKKSELRRVYNTILNSQKTSPLYKVEFNNDIQNYVINLKENARLLRNTIDSFSASNDSLFGFDKKVAYSDNENIVSASLVNDSIDTSDTEPITLEVYNLARPQLNVGNYLPPNSKGLSPGSYSFDISTSECEYEFQFYVKQDDTNKNIQDKISRLINNADIGLISQVSTDKNNLTAIKIQSIDSGIKNNSNTFNVRDNSTQTSGSVTYFGLNNLYRAPENANFTINNILNSSTSNNFTINKTYDLTLNGVSNNGEVTTIGLKNDLDSIFDNMNNFIKKYNSFAQLGKSDININSNGNKLAEDIKNLTKRHKNELESNGFIINDDNTITMDKSLITQAVNEGRLPEVLDSINSFKNDISRKTSQILIDPMAYVNKKIITYPNPTNKINNNPYMTSIYSGMMYNNYL